VQNDCTANQKARYKNLFSMGKDLWEIESGKFMTQTQHSAMIRHKPYHAKRLHSQSEGSLHELLDGKGLVGNKKQQVSPLYRECTAEVCSCIPHSVPLDASPSCCFLHTDGASRHWQRLIPLPRNRNVCYQTFSGFWSVELSANNQADVPKSYQSLSLIFYHFWSRILIQAATKRSIMSFLCFCNQS